MRQTWILLILGDNFTKLTLNAHYAAINAASQVIIISKLKSV